MTSIRGFCFRWDPRPNSINTPLLYAYGNTEGYLGFPATRRNDGTARSNMGKKDGFITKLGPNQYNPANQTHPGVGIITTSQIGSEECARSERRGRREERSDNSFRSSLA